MAWEIFDQESWLNKQEEKDFLKQWDIDEILKDVWWTAQALEDSVIKNYHMENQDNVDADRIDKIKSVVGEEFYNQNLKIKTNGSWVEWIAALQILALKCVEKLNIDGAEKTVEDMLTKQYIDSRAVDWILGPNTLFVLKEISKTDKWWDPMVEWDWVIDDSLLTKMTNICWVPNEPKEGVDKYWNTIKVVSDVNSIPQERKDKVVYYVNYPSWNAQYGFYNNWRYMEREDAGDWGILEKWGWKFEDDKNTLTSDKLTEPKDDVDTFWNTIKIVSDANNIPHERKDKVVYYVNYPSWNAQYAFYNDWKYGARSDSVAWAEWATFIAWTWKFENDINVLVPYKPGDDKKEKKQENLWDDVITWDDDKKEKKQEN